MRFFPFRSKIRIEHWHALNGHCSGLIWFTGLSGSGKSTLAHTVGEKLYNMGVRSYVLDGDNVRTGICSDLGLSPKDRIENVRRIAEAAKLMVDAGLLVFAAFIAPYHESRRFVRELMSGWPYYECYVKCPIEVCRERDPKGLYKKASLGEIRDMTGIGAPYEEPDRPDLTIETHRLSLDECVDQMIQFLLEKQLVFQIEGRGQRA